MSELKPCPHCGGGKIYIDSYDHDAGKRWRVVCLDCMATVDDGTTQQKYRAIEAWNRRAQPEHIVDVNKMMPDNARFAACHIWEPGDKLDTISDKCEVLIRPSAIRNLMDEHLGKHIANSYVEGYEDAKAGRPSLVKKGQPDNAPHPPCYLSEKDNPKRGGC